MKKKLILLACTASFLLSSCIKDEPLFREADITSFIIGGNTYIESSISDDKIQLIVSGDADYKKLKPVIQVSPGATITPASGVVQDFTNDIIYNVVSEDGHYSKQYTVNVKPRISLKYDFEDWYIVNEGKPSAVQYPTMTDLMWSNGNSGVGLAMVFMEGKFPTMEEYPTRYTTDCVNGKYAAFLETRRGGEIKLIGQNIPIFSGSLFRGKFNPNLNSPLKSLALGQIHPQSDGKPTSLTGYYKYKPGEVYTDTNFNPVEGKVDEFSIYAVVFKVIKGNEGKDEYLDGESVSDSTHPDYKKIIARAEITDTSAKVEFTKFSVPFIYSEDMDYENNDYKLTVVFASSKDGNLYEGAVGSTLVIDDVEVVCEKFKD